jgi:hypothetical protein
MLAAGQLGASDLVWREGMPHWIPAGATTLSSTSTLLAPPPPSPAAPLPLAYHRVSPTGYATMGKAPLVWTGIVLMLAFVLPIFDVGYSANHDETPRITFPNLSGQGIDGPLFVLFASLYPALAGVTILLLAPARGPGRGIGVLVVAMIPLVWGVAELLGSSDVANLLQQNPVAAMAGAAFVLLGTFGWMGLLLGAWVVRHRPRAKLGVRLATMGGIIYAVAWVLPVGDFDTGSLQWPIVALLEAMFDAETPPLMRIAMGILAAQAVAVLAAAVLCFLLPYRRLNSRPLANGIFRLALIAGAGCAWGIGTLWAGFYKLFFLWDPPSTAAQLMAAFDAIKGGAYALGLLLPLAVGLTDLLVALTPRTAEQVESPGA